MNCCKCKCSFKNCIEERKEVLTREFQQMIENWMKKHPEVKHVYISEDSRYSISNSIIIYSDREYKTTIHFE